LSTLYHHFPSKGAILVALARNELVLLTDAYRKER
jgi:AcrR family transcriptional regulator